MDNRQSSPGGEEFHLRAFYQRCKRVHMNHKNHKKFQLAALLLLSGAIVGGCVERELTINTSPQGALVIISDVEVGRTPLTMPFTWYGDYELIIRKDGYKTLNTHEPINPPIYEIPPLDLLSAIAPWTYRDQREFYYELEKYVAPDPELLIERAERLREENLTPVR